MGDIQRHVSCSCLSLCQCLLSSNCALIAVGTADMHITFCFVPACVVLLHSLHTHQHMHLFCVTDALRGATVQDVHLLCSPHISWPVSRFPRDLRSYACLCISVSVQVSKFALLLPYSCLRLLPQSRLLQTSNRKRECDMSSLHS